MIVFKLISRHSCRQVRQNVEDFRQDSRRCGRNLERDTSRVPIRSGGAWLCDWRRSGKYSDTDQCVRLQCRRMDRVSYRPVWGNVCPGSLRHHASNCFYNSRYSRTKQQSYQNCFRPSRFLGQISGIWGLRTLFQLLQAHAQNLKCAAAQFPLGTVQSGYEKNDRTMSDRTPTGAEIFLFCTVCSAAVTITLPPPHLMPTEDSRETKAVGEWSWPLVFTPPCI